MEELLSASQAAEMLGLSKATVIRWLNAGKLPGQRIGNGWAVPAAAVAAASNPPAGRSENDPYTPTEAAAELGISTALVHHHLNGGRLAGERGEDGRWVIAAAEVRRFKAEPRSLGRPKGSTKGKGRKKGKGREPAGSGGPAAE